MNQIILNRSFDSIIEFPKHILNCFEFTLPVGQITSTPTGKFWKTHPVVFG